MLKEKTLFGIIDKVKESIKLLKDMEPEEGYYLAFSGGKDSVCIKRLADMAGVKYDAHYNVTTIDPPELVYFIRDYHKDVIWEHPEKNMLVKMIDKQFPPLRQQRWCCELYKEGGGSGRIVITGIRKAESAKRAKRKAVERDYKNETKQIVNPIIDWSDDDVWEFIKQEKLPYCSLYDEGWKRIGCLFCPMAGKSRLMEAKRYPNYVKFFIRHFEKLYQWRKENDKPLNNWNSGEEMFWWWMNDNRKSEDSDQTIMFE